MKKIELDLAALSSGVSGLEKLKDKVKDNHIKIPEVKGSGETLVAIYSLAETFKRLEDTWETLIEESVRFFESVEQTHKDEQSDLAAAIKGSVNK